MKFILPTSFLVFLFALSCAAPIPSGSLVGDGVAKARRGFWDACVRDLRNAANDAKSGIKQTSTDVTNKAQAAAAAAKAAIESAAKSAEQLGAPAASGAESAAKGAEEAGSAAPNDAEQ